MQAFASIGRRLHCSVLKVQEKARHPFKAQRSGFEWKRRYNKMSEL